MAWLPYPNVRRLRLSCSLQGTGRNLGRHWCILSHRNPPVKCAKNSKKCSRLNFSCNIIKFCTFFDICLDGLLLETMRAAVYSTFLLWSSHYCYSYQVTGTQPTRLTPGTIQILDRESSSILQRPASQSRPGGFLFWLANPGILSRTSAVCLGSVESAWNTRIIRMKR